MNLHLTLAQAKALKIMLVESGDDGDERLLVDMVDGETDAFDLVRKLLNEIEIDEGIHAALTEQMAIRKARRDRSEARNEKRRDAIAAIMACVGIDKLPLAEATVSLRTLPAKIAINDTAAVPEEYTKPNPKPDMDAIKSAFKPGDALPNWLRLDPERPSLIVRRK